MCMAKYDWKKSEKEIYLPQNKPEIINIPSFNFFTIIGKGSPNAAAFSEAVGVLYSLAYGIKMLPKQGVIPEGYFEYSIYPLEGIWDLSEEAKRSNTFDKNELIYEIMLRQPSFVTEELAIDTIQRVKNKKPHSLLEEVKFKAIEDGRSVQMLHIGAYDDEPETFRRMGEFCAANGLERTRLTHREIYITDARKTAAEKLKTVLRFAVKEIM